MSSCINTARLASFYIQDPLDVLLPFTPIASYTPRADESQSFRQLFILVCVCQRMDAILFHTVGHENENSSARNDADALFRFSCTLHTVGWVIKIIDQSGPLYWNIAV